MTATPNPAVNLTDRQRRYAPLLVSLCRFAAPAAVKIHVGFHLHRMPYYYRSRKSRRSYSSYGSQHISQRDSLSRTFAGIDKDIEKIFLSLENSTLNSLLASYSEKFGKSAEIYARTTYQKWRSGSVKMSGQTASRLLELLPPLLPASTKFELIRKLRQGHFKKRSIYIKADVDNWKQSLIKPIQELVAESSSFSLPAEILIKARWLSDGDSASAERLLVAAEQEEAAIRVAFLEDEMRRIESILRDLDATRRMSHTIELPQGSITLNIELPARTLVQRLTDWLK